jgi:hypothetical protein
MKLTATITNGRLVFDDHTALAVFLGKNEGKKVVINIATKTTKRTLNQNSYLWSVVVPLLCDAIGYPASESEECWNAVKIAVGHYKETKIGNVALPTKDMDTKAFAELTDRVRTFASAELGVRIPSAHEFDYDV